jgi:DNA-binding CsgD family transcriptional regulator
MCSKILKTNIQIEKPVCLVSQFLCLYTFPDITFISVEGNIKGILGFGPEKADVDFIQIHNADKEIVTKFDNYILQRLKYEKEIFINPHLYNIDFRLKKRNGKTIKVLRNSGLYPNDNQKSEYIFFHLYTDITLHKKSNVVCFSVKDDKGNNIELPDIENVLKTLRLSEKEKQIMQYISENMTSNEIAQQMSLSKHTIDAHRRTLIKKTGLKSTSEIIEIARKQGILI